MIVVGDDLVLRIGEKRSQARVIPELYHTLKTFDHIALAIDVTLAAAGDGSPIPDDVLHDLREYRKLLPAARERIPASGLDAEQRERQKAIVDACSGFLDSVLERLNGGGEPHRLHQADDASADRQRRGRGPVRPRRAAPPGHGMEGRADPGAVESTERADHRPATSPQGQPRGPVLCPGRRGSTEKDRGSSTPRGSATSLGHSTCWPRIESTPRSPSTSSMTRSGWTATSFPTSHANICRCSSTNTSELTPRRWEVPMPGLNDRPWPGLCLRSLLLATSAWVSATLADQVCSAQQVEAFPALSSILHGDVLQSTFQTFHE